MGSVLNLNTSLVALAKKHVECNRGVEALTLLQRIVGRSNLPIQLEAESHYLLAKVHLRSGRYQQAAADAKAASKLEPSNSDYHFLLGQCLEQVLGAESKAVVPFKKASRLAPEDGKKAVACARRIATSSDPSKGLNLLHDAYDAHGRDPNVVSNVVDALIEADRWMDAELVVAQSSAANGTDSRFVELRRQFKIQKCIKESNQVSRIDPGPVLLPFRNPRERGPKPRLLFRRRGTSDGRFVYESEDPAPIHEPAGCILHSRMKLGGVLRRAGRAQVNTIHRYLDLDSAESNQKRRDNIEHALLQGRALSSIVRSLKVESRKLLRTIIRVGGYVPAGVLSQNTADANAGKGNAAEALFKSGLVYRGFEPSSPSKASDTEIAMIPLDLFVRLSRILGIRV